MVIISNQYSECIGRSISCNELKKRKIIRAKTIQNKINTNQEKDREKYWKDDHQRFVPNSVYKYSIVNDKKNYLSKLINVIREMENKNSDNMNNGYENQTQKFRIHRFSKQGESTNSLKNSGLRKATSMKTLYKNFPRSTINNPNKLHPNTLKRITQNPHNDRHPTTTQLQKKYKTAPQTSAIRQHKYHRETHPSTQKQNIYFNQISPIHQKYQYQLQPSKEQVSGFSLLEDIASKVENNRKENYLEGGGRKQKIYINKLIRQQLHAGAKESEIKMRKHGRKCLPNDFFVKV